MGLVRWHRGKRPIYLLLCNIISRLSLLCCWRNPPKAPPCNSSTPVLKYLQWFYGSSQMMSKLWNPEFNSVASPHFWTYLGWPFRVHPYTPAKLSHMPLGVSSYPPSPCPAIWLWYSFPKGKDVFPSPPVLLHVSVTPVSRYPAQIPPIPRQQLWVPQSEFLPPLSFRGTFHGFVLVFSPHLYGKS